MNDDSSPVPRSEVETDPRLPKCIENLWKTTGFCKTTLIVGKENIQENDLRPLFYDYSRESQREKKHGSPRKNTTLQALEQVMEYTFTGRLELGGLEERTILEILKLAHRYELKKLQTALSLYLRRSLSVFNVCAVSATAKLLNLDQLLDFCLRFIDVHACAILRTEAFCQLPADNLEQILSRDSFCADELDIFNAVKRWCRDKEMNQDVESVLQRVRLPLIELDDLLKTVGPSKLIPVERFKRAVGSKLGDSNCKLNYRGSLVREENVASADRRAHVLTREPLRIDFLPPRNHPAIDWDRRILRHDIQEPLGITIALGEPYILNNIVLRLFDRETCSFSYYVEVSANYVAWDRVVDFSKRSRRSLQRIFFEPRVVRFIRVVGTQSTRFNSLFVTSIKASYSDQCPKLTEEENEPPEFMSGAGENLNHQQLRLRRAENRIYVS